MKKNKNFIPKDEKLHVFVPFVNLLLFEKFESPNFYLENAKLSENFIEAVKIINDTSIDSSDYFKMKVQYFITELSEGKRRLIFDSIIQNELFMSAMSFTYTIENNLSMNNESSLISHTEILKNLLNFTIKGEMSKVLFYFFGLYFEHIFYVESSDENYISQTAYDNLFENLLKNP
ncbi:hypothetical protein DNC80_00030 [Flavobacterium sp. SOK18b]|uniref:hypothetical protein n=1 Tax=Flavobacterium sp. SOK18b TaxID=797900 RepID=UPI0015F7ADC0|nr:hypothetical protein [Flavobacterium sp. SOK18b]MBB1192061.1 hypothetical protein [Flavobacterium sp. SOK18b]